LMSHQEAACAATTMGHVRANLEKFRQAPRIPVHVCDVASSGEVLQPTSTQSYQSDAMMLIGGLVAVAMALSTSSTTSSHISHSASHVHSPATPIDRESVVRRHVVVLSRVGSDPRADTAHITYGALTMTVGNGVIGFNADATGMQSLNLTCVFSTLCGQTCTCDLSPISHLCMHLRITVLDRSRAFVPYTPPSLKRKCPETRAIHNV
jgi:hypothetical protein